jgi:hypothetical protein
MAAGVLPAIQGVVADATAGATLVNAFLVVLQGVGYDVQDSNNVSFLFNFREEDSEDLKSDITDHYTETNSALQDQISLKPVTCTLHGFIGELTDQQSGIAAEVQLIASQLTVFAPYVPALTVAAQQYYNQAQQIYNAASSAAATLTQAFNFVTGKGSLTKQQQAFAFFKSRWQSRSLFSVQTPWEILPNMAIEELHAVQEGDSQQVSDFRITFKQMNFASTLSSASTIAGQGRYAFQAANSTNQGAQNPPSVGPLSPSGSPAADFASVA